jgi:hypothetical protein
MNEMKKELEVLNDVYCDYLRNTYSKYFTNGMSDVEVEEAFKHLFSFEYYRMQRVMLGGNRGVHKLRN